MRIGKFLLAGAVSLALIGCSGNQEKSAVSNAEKPATGSQSPTADTAAAEKTQSLCVNKYFPVKNGLKTSFDSNNVTGKSKVLITQSFVENSSEFTQDWVFDKLNLKQLWRCTPQGIVAPNYGSSLEASGGVKSETKHISGVTIPTESEISVGKAWTANYEVVTQTPGLDKPVNTPVKVENKILSLDDEVKTPGGTFKAMKIESMMTVSVVMNGKTMTVPPIKSDSWYAPGVGLVKTEGVIPGFGKSTLEYAGAN